MGYLQPGVRVLVIAPGALALALLGRLHRRLHHVQVLAVPRRLARVCCRLDTLLGQGEDAPVDGDEAPQQLQPHCAGRERVLAHPVLRGRGWG